MRQNRPYQSPYAAMLWSLVLPGFGQLYNKDYVIGFVLLVLEFLVNLKSDLNITLLYSFMGNLQASHQSVDYGWGLFYPSIYGFAIWQAFNSAKASNRRAAGKEAEQRTYLTGFAIGLTIGMDFGLFWHDQSWIKMSIMLDFPVFNGLTFGLLFGAIGHLLEKKLYRKNKKRTGVS